MTALTLVEAAKLEMGAGNTHKAGVISLYAEKSDIMNAMRFEGIGGNAYAFTQEGDLPSTAFRGVNEGFTPSTGTFNPQKEALMLAGGELDVDNFIIQTEGEGVRSKHEALKIKSLSQAITDTIITGDNSTEVREFDGLQVRATGTQLIDNGSTSGGDVLSLSKLDEAIENTASPTHIIMSRALRRAFTAAMRSSTSGVGSNLLMERDELGKPIMTYNSLPILVGYERNKNTSVLPYTEANPGGGSAASTSIYVVNFGEDGVIGISNGGIRVKDLGELENLPVWRTRVEWYLGMAVQNPYAITRLRGIKTGAIAA